jgi:REP element-mobilizing transposase RayT
VLITFLIVPLTSFAQSDFLARQKKDYSRVRTAFAGKEQFINDHLERNGITPDSVHILITAYKAEKILEIYAKKKTETAYKRIAARPAIWVPNDRKTMDKYRKVSTISTASIQQVAFTCRSASTIRIRLTEKRARRQDWAATYSFMAAALPLAAFR